MSTRFAISLLVSMMVAAVLFGVGATIVLSVPSLSVHAMLLLPWVVVASLVLAPIASWFMAPMLRAKYSRQIEAGKLIAQRVEARS